MHRSTLLATSLAMAVAATPAAAAVPPQVETIRTAAGNIHVSEVAGGLVHPWGVDVLPDGRLLVSERPGRLRLVTPEGEVSAPLAGTPEVWANGQGGLLDVALDPDFADNRRVWLSYADAVDGGATTALGHGRLEDDAIADFETIFRMQPAVAGPNHFGGRIVFADDGSIFLTLGERYKFEPAQDLESHLGTIVRIDSDGEPAAGNPFLDREDARAEIWSYGHRNIQAAAIHPETGRLWVAEMGPLGGDELNRIEAGANYGWPVVSWGTHYDGRAIPDPPTHPEFATSVKQWTPVIAPSGMIFYAGDAFEAFKGDALIGGLVSEGLTRLEIADGEVRAEEHIPLSVRIRDVVEARDGALYVLVDRADGAIWRLAPLD